MLKLAYNPTDQVELADDEGHLVGGRSWGAVDTTSVAGKAALDNDRLIVVKEDTIGADSNPDAVAALADLEDRRNRLQAAKNLDKALLEQRLEEADVEVPDGASKTELAAAAADSDDVDLSKAKGRASGAKK